MTLVADGYAANAAGTLSAMSRVMLIAAASALGLGGASLPLRTVATRPLPGGSSRLDYASIDSKRHRLYISHLGGGLVIVFDTKARRVVKTIPAPGAHGVLVVPSLHRVFASATNDRQLVTIDARTNKVVSRAPAGEYPDGIAYDSADHRIYVSDESGSAEIVFGAGGRRIGAVPLGGEAGNVQYDPVSGRVLVDVQSRDEVAVISTRTNRVIRRVSLPGCDHPHGLLVDAPRRLAFVDLRREREAADARPRPDEDHRHGPTSATVRTCSPSTSRCAGSTSRRKAETSPSSPSAAARWRSSDRRSSRPRRIRSRSTRARTSCTSRSRTDRPFAS